MKRDFKTIKNIILLIASALTLVAVTFSWFSMSKKVGNFTIDQSVSGATLSVQYYKSDDGSSYTKLDGDISMDNMYEGKTAYYRMDVKTFKKLPIKLVMSFEGLTSSNTTARYVYFDYKVVCNSTSETISEGSGLKMSDYVSTNVFVADVSALQKNDYTDFSVYYNVYVVTGGEDISGTASLGEVKLTGQQIS